MTASQLKLLEFNIQIATPAKWAPMQSVGKIQIPSVSATYPQLLKKGNKGFNIFLFKEPFLCTFLLQRLMLKY